MNYSELFVNAWKTIWKSKLIWLFNLIVYAGSFIVLYGRGFSKSIVCFLFPFMIIALFLGGMGLVLTVYGVVKDDHPSLADIWRLIKNYWADFLLSNFYAFWLSIVVAAVLFVIQMALILLLIVPAIDISRRDLIRFAIYSSIGISGYTFIFLTSIFFCAVVNQQLKIAEGIHQGWVLIKRNLKEISWIILVFGVVGLLSIIFNWFFPWIYYLTQLISFIINPLMVSVFVLAYLKFAEREYEPQAISTIGGNGPLPPTPPQENLMKNSPKIPLVQLRDMSGADLDIFFEQQLDPEANHMAAFTAKDPSDRITFNAHWAKVLADRTITIQTILYDGQVAGSVLCHSWGGEPEISYWLGKEFWGKGIATQALSLFLEVEKRRPLTARVAKDNLASIRVLEKCGFTLSGEGSWFSNARGKEVEELIFVLK